MRDIFSFNALSFLATAMAVLTAASPTDAVEPVQEFLDGLNNREYYDVALDYMDQIKDSPAAPDDFKKNLLYEQGKTLVNLARVTADAKLKENAFNRARKKLDEFAKANPGTAPGVRANTQVANLLVEQGRSALRKSSAPSNSANKKSLTDQARTYFDEALKVYDQVEVFYRKKLADVNVFPKMINRKQNPKLFKLRQEFRGEHVQTRLLLANVVYEKSKTHEDGSEARNKLLQEAADKYGDLYEKYRKWLAGLYARLYQGRCYQDMKKYKEAIAYYDDLIEQPAQDPVFRSLIAKTYLQLAQCYNAQENYNATIARTDKWLRDAQGNENRTTEWLGLKYLVALAYKEKSRSTDPDEQKEKNKSIREARSLLRDPARIESEWRRRAKKLLSSLAVSKGNDEAKTFTEAYDIGKESLDLMLLKQSLLPNMKTNDAPEVPRMREEIEQAKEKATKFFALALRLADENTDLDTLNLVRYYLCFLHYQARHYYDAAVLGEFLANNYPESSAARPAAKIAMASYVTNYNDPNNKDKDFDADQVIRVSELIATRWAESPEADEAYSMLVSFNLMQEKFDEAVEALAKISPESPIRGQSELQIGQSLWTRYLKSLKLPEEQRPPREELDQMKASAEKTLASGVTRMKKNPVTPAVAGAALSLVQIYLDTSQPKKAVELLEDPKLGPLTLVQKKDPVVDRPGYAEATYKAALRAYVTVQPPQQEKAEQVMDSLEAYVSEKGDAEAKETLTKIFVSLGVQLKKQMDILREEGKTDEIENVSKSFEAFLDRIRKRNAGNDWATRNWIASTYFNLGEGQAGDKKISAKAKSYYNKAVEGYKKILDEVKAGKIEPPGETSVLGVKIRLAGCLEKLGDYKESLNMLAEILKEKPMMLDAQIAAANAYHQRGMLGGEKNARWFKFAIFGGRKDKKTKQNRIWGWGKIANTTYRHKQHRDVFHESRYRMTESRLEWAKTKQGADRKEELGRAKNDIRYISKLFPDMGGAERSDAYDRLLKRIQKEAGDPAIGLKEFEKQEKQIASRKKT